MPPHGVERSRSGPASFARRVHFRCRRAAGGCHIGSSLRRSSDAFVFTPLDQRANRHGCHEPSGRLRPRLSDSARNGPGRLFVCVQSGIAAGRSARTRGPMPRCPSKRALQPNSSRQTAFTPGSAPFPAASFNTTARSKWRSSTRSASRASTCIFLRSVTRACARPPMRSSRRAPQTVSRLRTPRSAGLHARLELAIRRALRVLRPQRPAASISAAVDGGAGGVAGGTSGGASGGVAAIPTVAITPSAFARTVSA